MYYLILVGISRCLLYVFVVVIARYIRIRMERLLCDVTSSCGWTPFLQKYVHVVINTTITQL